MRIELDISVKNERSDFYLFENSSVENLFNDRQALEELVALRQNSSDKKFEFSENLRNHLEQIFNAFKPIAQHLIENRISKFPNINLDNRLEITDEQYFRLWNFLVAKFRWQNFPDADYASKSFVVYLKKATGNFFVKEIIDGGRLTKMSALRGIDQSLDRPVEEIVISNEDPEKIKNAWLDWLETSSNRYIIAIREHFIEEIPLEDLARKYGISVELLTKHLRLGKKLLANLLIETGVLSPDYFVTKNFAVGESSSRKELLDRRREIIIKNLPNWETTFSKSPKLLEAIEYYFGTNGNEPLYDYQKTAEKLNCTKSAASMLISKGVRLITGKLKPSEEGQENKIKHQLYSYWQQHSDTIGLSEEEQNLLESKIGKKMLDREIANNLNVSRKTVANRVNRIFGLIQIAMNSNTRLTF